MNIFRRYFLAGLLVLVPILATVFVLSVIIDLLDHSLALLPTGYRPEDILGYRIPGFGVILSLLIVFLTGTITTNIVGHHVVAWAERMLTQIPFISTVYQSSKQVLHTVFSQDSRSFRHVCLVEYPRQGIWTLAFETGEPSQAIKEQDPVGDLITVFVPTTPNPTSGFLLFVSRAETRPLNMNVDDAFKLIISLGVVQPQSSTSPASLT